MEECGLGDEVIASLATHQHSSVLTTDDELLALIAPPNRHPSLLHRLNDHLAVVVLQGETFSRSLSLALACHS